MHPRSRIFSYRMALADEHIKLFSNLSNHIRSAEVNGVFHNGVGLLIENCTMLIEWLYLVATYTIVLNRVRPSCLNFDRT